MHPFQPHILPTLTVNDAPAALDFYKRAFGAYEIMRNESDGHTVGIISIEGVQVIVADESPEHGNLGPDKQSSVSVRLGLMVADPDAIAERAIAAGITVIYPVENQDYGYRLGHFVDPFGHHWEIGRPL